MAEASRRAARPAAKGGLSNALFVVAAAESPPPELSGVFDLVTITLPWGSLLRGALALDPRVTAGIAALVAPGGRAELVVAPADRDHLASLPTVQDRLENGLAAGWAAFGMRLVAADVLQPADVAGLPSTWARRLGLGQIRGDRLAWRLVLRRETPR